METFNDNIRNEFKEIWKGSIRSFANRNSINQGNFSSWLEGKKDSEISERCVKRFLDETKRLWPDGVPEEIYNDTYNVHISLPQCVNRMKSLDKVKTIVFVDANELTNKISLLHKIEENVHIILVFSLKQVIVSLIFDLTEDRENVRKFSILKSKTDSKDASLTHLVCAMATLNMILDPSISFVFVSKTRPFDEIYETFKEYGCGRNVYCRDISDLKELI